MTRALRLLGAHWYAPAFVAIVAATWTLARTPDFMESGGEAALLIDLCVTAPLLYLLCYAKRQTLGTSLVRALAISCGGVWLAAWLVPPAEQVLLPQLTAFRWAGLAVVALIEIRILVAVIKVVFSNSGSVDEVSKAGGVPRWVAQLMLLEARFWRAVWRLIRGGNRREP